MKMGAVIQIVKKLNQAEKLNDQIDKYISDSYLSKLFRSS